MDLPKQLDLRLPHWFSVEKVQQDTTDTLLQQQVAPELKPLNTARLDSLMRVEEQREQEIREQQQQIRRVVTPKKELEKDTLLIQYQTLGFYDSSLTLTLQDEFTLNPFLNIPSTRQMADRQPVFYEAQPALAKSGKKAYTVEATQDAGAQSAHQSFVYETGSMTFVLLLSMVIVGSLSLFYKRHLQRIVKAIGSFSEAQLIYRERNSPLQRASAQMNFLFHTMIAVLLGQWIAFNGIEVLQLGFWEIMFALFLGMNALYVYRFIISRVIGYLFDLKEVFHEFFFHMYLFPKVLGLVLFPVTVLIQYGTGMLQTTLFNLSMGLVALFYLGQTLRSFRVIIKYNVSILFLILYLCAFEIVPVIWVYKLISLAL
jgi:hypothetical protein